MDQYLNERQIHPLEIRVEILERLLSEAVTIIQAKTRPGDTCLLGGWLDEAILVLEGEAWT